MKTGIFITGLLGILLFTSCSKPNPKDILRKAYQKGKSIDNGYYEMTYIDKGLAQNDTAVSLYTCYFKKIKTDTSESTIFHHDLIYNGKYIRDELYTGNEYVQFSEQDSTGRIISKDRYSEVVKSFYDSRVAGRYMPILNNAHEPFPEDSSYSDEDYSFEYLGVENVSNHNCFHIKITINLEDNNQIKSLRHEQHFWINKRDYLPIQYATEDDIVVYNDTMYQYHKYQLTKYDFDNLKDEEQLNLSSIPPYIHLKDFKPSKSPELLPKDSIAPSWSLVSLNDESISLSDLREQLVLIDFFYKSCYPCMLALPALQDLHERYKDKGLKIIGIDPYDTKEKDHINDFLAKRGVTYTVLLGGEDVAKEYHVSGFPTIYLIDKEGKIIFSQVGYGKGTEKALEKIIKHNL